MKVTVKLNYSAIRNITEQEKNALIDTAEALKTEIIKSQTMPFLTGALQNDTTFVDTKNVSKGKVSLVSDEPYARKLYHHPEYKFNKTGNPNAGGKWYEPYISGNKSEWTKEIYAKRLKARLKT